MHLFQIDIYPDRMTRYRTIQFTVTVKDKFEAEEIASKAIIALGLHPLTMFERSWLKAL